MNRMRIAWFDFSPSVDESAWVAPSAVLVGSVFLGPHVSVFFHSVLRADNESITIGSNSNIQDACIIHNDTGYPVSVGHHVTVGHKTILHGAIIDDETLIGMDCTILNGCHIGRHCLIGAGSLLLENTKIPDGSVVVGRPGRVIRETTQEDIQKIRDSAQNYARKKDLYANIVR